jgi:hypothetical protein
LNNMIGKQQWMQMFKMAAAKDKELDELMKPAEP